MMANKKLTEDSKVQDPQEGQQLSAPELSVPELATVQSSHAPLGELLLAARNAKKLTQKDVSNSLRISIKQITALETDDFALLPEAMITRGFIRNYARLLEIDAEPLLASYRAQMPDKTPTTLSVHSSMYEVMSGKDSQPWLMYILSSILVLLFLLAWLFYVDYMPKPAAEKQPQSVVLPTQPSTVMALPEVALPAAERQPDASVDAAGIVINSATLENPDAPTVEIIDGHSGNTVSSTPNTNPVTPLPNTAAVIDKTPANDKALASSKTQISPSLPLSTEKKLGQATPQAGQPVPSSAVDFNSFKANAAQASENVKSPPNSTTKKVSVTVDEQTWIRVSDKSGAVVFEKLLAAGSADGFDGEPPFSVLVGNAKATKLMFLGKPLDLTRYTKDNVARLVLQ